MKDSHSAQVASEKVIRGSKVRVVGEPLTPKEEEAKRSSIADVIAKTLLKKKEA